MHVPYKYNLVVRYSETDRSFEIEGNDEGLHTGGNLAGLRENLTEAICIIFRAVNFGMLLQIDEY
jgi:hypothetical protein